MKPVAAVIGGTGINHSEIFTDIEELTISTDYGHAYVKSVNYKGDNLLFLERHGKNHCLAPHEINYKANIAALSKLGVERIIATAAVGAINLKYTTGSFVLIDDFIDFTKQRSSTFFEKSNQGVVHIDVSEPYCPELRQSIMEAGKSLNISLFDGGTYICSEGPRFETKAEIKAFALIGGDVVGMTNVPEVILAREKGICYSTIAMVTNYAAGISSTPLTHQEVIDNMNQMSSKIKDLILGVVGKFPSQRNCSCKYAAREQGSLK